MIEKLRKRDLEKAIIVSPKGLSLETPPGNMNNKIISRELKKTICYVHKTKGNLDGLTNFKINKNGNITLMFICAIRPRQGIGTELMHEVAKFALKKKIKWIYSGVSSKDKRATKFYYSLKFKPYSKTGQFGYYIKAKPTDVV